MGGGAGARFVCQYTVRIHPYISILYCIRFSCTTPALFRELATPLRKDELFVVQHNLWMIAFA